MGIPDEGVDLEGVDVVKLLESQLDLGLVGLDVDDEDQSVVLLNLLHGALGVERADDDLVLIEARKMGNRLARVLGGAGDDESLGAVERSAQANLALLLGVGLARVQVSHDELRLETGEEALTPLRAAFAAALACLEPLGAATYRQYASAIALVQNSQNLLLP